MKFGILFRPVSFWVGCHYSPANKRLCVNIVPFITFWFAAENGQTPRQGYDIYRNDKQGMGVSLLNATTNKLEISS